MGFDCPVSRRGFLTGAGTVGLVAAASSAVAQEGTTHTVDMTDDLVFDPDEITIAPGDTVVWENVGTIGHTVTAYEDELPDGAEFFASGDAESESDARSAYPPGGNLSGGQTFQRTFDVEGSTGTSASPTSRSG